MFLSSLLQAITKLLNLFILFETCNSFSLKSSLPMEFTFISTEDPVILSISNLIPRHSAVEIANKLREVKCEATTSYQEDIFAQDASKREDEHFMAVVKPFLDQIPPEYLTSNLESFVYVVTKFQDRLNEEDIIKGANFIQRRKALERWETEEGQILLKLAADGNEFESNIGKRWQVPMDVLEEFKILIPRLLMGDWIIHDATIVTYQEGQSQVPHLDPCDATILVCLKESDVGGETCFPLIGQKVKNQCGNGILFFSSAANNGDDQSIMSLHHGGKVIHGEKMVLQIMLNRQQEMRPSTSWIETLNIFE